MTIDDVHKIIDTLLVQEKKGKTTPAEKDIALHLAQIDYFNDLRPQLGSQKPVMAQSTNVHEALNPFRVVQSFNNGNTPGGLLQIPDSEHILSVLTQITTQGIVKYKGVPLMNDDELAHRLDSQLVGPTERDPIIHFKGNKEIQFYPATPKAGTVTYLKKPEPPVWAFTENGRNLKYSPGRSTDLLWNDTQIPQVLMRALQYLGATLEAETVFQAAQLKQSETR